MGNTEIHNKQNVNQKQRQIQSDKIVSNAFYKTNDELASQNLQKNLVSKNPPFNFQTKKQVIFQTDNFLNENCFEFLNSEINSKTQSPDNNKLFSKNNERQLPPHSPNLDGPKMTKPLSYRMLPVSLITGDMSRSRKRKDMESSSQTNNTNTFKSSLIQNQSSSNYNDVILRQLETSNNTKEENKKEYLSVIQNSQNRESINGKFSKDRFNSRVELSQDILETSNLFKPQNDFKTKPNKLKTLNQNEFTSFLNKLQDSPTKSPGLMHEMNKNPLSFSFMPGMRESVIQSCNYDLEHVREIEFNADTKFENWNKCLKNESETSEQAKSSIVRKMKGPSFRESAEKPSSFKNDPNNVFYNDKDLALKSEVSKQLPIKAASVKRSWLIITPNSIKTNLGYFL